MQTSTGILNYIPQRPPFVMVDEILYSDEKITRTAFLIKSDNIFVQAGVLKEPGLVENMAQTAAARAGFTALQQNEQVKIGYIGAINRLEINGFPQIGQTIITEITIENQIFDVSLVTAKIMCNDKLFAQCAMKIFITN